MGNRVVWGWVVLPALLLVIGCSTRQPATGLDFSPEEKVIVTFGDGTSLTGRIDNGEVIRYGNEDGRFRGQVESVDETEIVISDLVAIDDRSNFYQQQRMEHFRLYVDDVDLDRLILSRDDILQVERIVPDRGRTLRRTAFWAIGVGVTVLAVTSQNF